jgi:hypothetical protein
MHPCRRTSGDWTVLPVRHAFVYGKFKDGRVQVTEDQTRVAQDNTTELADLEVA